MGVTIKGLDKLQRKFDTMPDRLDKAIYLANNELAERVASEARNNLSSIKYPSGELLNSIKTNVEQEKGTTVARVFTDKKQGAYREFGTGPVGQASEKMLPSGVTPVYTPHAWYFPVDSVDVDLTERYSIPKININGKQFYRTNGQKARPWLYPAFVEVMQNDSEEVYKRHVKEQLKGLEI